MSTRLAVDRSNTLKEFSDYPAIVRISAKIISYVFHPVFVPVYVVLFLIYIHPTMFIGHSALENKLTVLQALLMYGFFPIISVLLLKAVKFIDSIYLTGQKDRIIPYVICNIWYFWIYYVWRNLPDSPRELVLFSMSIFIASAIGLLANIYMKISMHAIAIGITSGFMTYLALTQPVSFGLYLSVALLVGGIVCTSRFIVSNHTAREIYGGLLAGIVSLFIARLFT